MSSCLLKCYLKLFFYKSYIFNIYVYQQDLVLNNLEGLICYKTQPTYENNNLPNMQSMQLYLH